MGVISPYETHGFKSAEFIFSKVKRFLHSYDTANLIDEGEFPKYVNEILRDLGIAVYKELDAVINVVDFQGKMPDDFSVLYAAYKCTASFSKHDHIHEQGSPVVVYQDVTWELLKGAENCQIETCNTPDKILERVEVRTYIKENAVTGSLTNPVLLTLSPNVKKHNCSSDCQNLLATSPYEITISDGQLFTNFEQDAVYMKYYGIPKDENGVPMIPDIECVEKAIEWCIIYQLLMTWYFNKQVTDIDNVVKFANMEYTKAKNQAKYYNKVPTFARWTNWARRRRSNSAVLVMAQIDSSGYWQTT